MYVARSKIGRAGVVDPQLIYVLPATQKCKNDTQIGGWWLERVDPLAQIQNRCLERVDPQTSTVRGSRIPTSVGPQRSL